MWFLIEVVKLFIFFILAFAACHLGAVGAPSDPVLQLTLGEALEMAERGSPDLLVVDQGVEVARSAVVIAGQRPNPSLGYAFPIGPAERKQRLIFNIPLETGGRRGARLALADAGVSEAELGVARARQLLLNQTRNAYVELAVAKAALKQNLGDLEFYGRLTDVATRRFEAGDIAEAEVIRADFEREQIQRLIYPAENRVEAGEIALNRLLGRALKTQIEVVDDGHLFPTDPLLEGSTWDVPSLEALQQIARERRPDLALARQGVETSQRRIALARANQSPDLSLQSTLLYDPYFPAFSYQVGVQLEIPLGSDRGGEVQQAQAREQESQLRQSVATADVETAVAVAWTNFQAARRQLSHDLKILKPRAAQVLSLSEKIYELGQGDITEVLLAGQSVLRQRQLYLADVAQLHRALGELELAVNATLIGDDL